MFLFLSIFYEQLFYVSSIYRYRKQLCSLSPMELYNEKKNVLLKKHIVQTELVEYENSIKRVLGMIYKLLLTSIIYIFTSIIKQYLI